MEFIDNAIAKNTKDRSEGRILLKAHRAALLLKAGDLFACKNLLEGSLAAVGEVGRALSGFLCSWLVG